MCVIFWVCSGLICTSVICVGCRMLEERIVSVCFHASTVCASTPMALAVMSLCYKELVDLLPEIPVQVWRIWSSYLIKHQASQLNFCDL